MANAYFEEIESSPNFGWHAPDKTPFEHIYGQVPGSLPSPSAPASPVLSPVLPFCSANLSGKDRRRSGCPKGGCPEGRAGPLCEQSRPSFCMRGCSGRGQCDAGFCWCEPSWFGIDCSHHESGDAPRLQAQQLLPSPAARSALKIFVYDMPSEFTTRNLQWRGSHGIGLSRAIHEGTNASIHHSGELHRGDSTARALHHSHPVARVTGPARHRVG